MGGSLPLLPVSRRTPEDRLSEQEDVLNWLRDDKSPKSDTPEGHFKAVDQMLPIKKGQSPEDRARDIENALDWVRQVNIPSGVEEPVGEKFGSLPSLPISRRTPEERLSEQEDVL